MKGVGGYFFCALLLLGFSAIAQTCPPAPTSIDPLITADVTFDKASKTYTYRYTIANGRGALIPVEFLAMRVQERPAALTSGAKWSVMHYPANDARPAIVDFEALPQKSDLEGIPDDITVSPDLPRLASAIKPGASLSGFSLKSPNPPGVVQYFAEGLTQSPKAVGNVEMEELEELNSSCPGWGSNASRFASMVSGMTTGPVDPNTISLAIRLRDERGLAHCGQFNPEEKKGRISVLIMNSKDLDVRDITVSSLRFGPGEAAPVDSKLVVTGGESRASFDEHEHWEKISELFGRGQDKRPQQNLLVTFDSMDVAAKCVLDKALFLRGKTKNGQDVVGGVTSPFVGCDIHKPGTRHKRSEEPHPMPGTRQKHHRK